MNKIDHILLWVVDRTSSSTDAKLRFRVKWCGSRCVVSLSPGYNVDADKWIQEAQRCKANTTHTKDNIPAVVINKRLTDYEDAANAVFEFFEGKGFIPTPEEFKDEFNIMIGKKRERREEPIIDRFDEFIEIVGVQNNWAHNTYKEFNTLRNMLQAFTPKIKTTDDITDSRLLMFERWMIEQGYKNSYIRKTIKNMQNFIRWLVRNGYYDGSSHETFNVKLKGTDDHIIVYLEWDELQKLFYMPIQSKRLSEIRDIFCFCSFTSLRFSDVSKLQWCDVNENTINIVTEKTTDALIIDLNDYSKAILNKYRGTEIKNGLVFPVPTNQEFNRAIKEICKEAGFNKPLKKVFYSGNKRVEEVHPKYELISSHCGRRTFIVNALYLGIPAEVVMKWTGHSDYNAMKPYIEIIDDLKVREMNKFNLGPKRN